MERDVRRSGARARRFGAGHVLLPLTSLVAVLTIGLAYGGRIQSVTRSAAGSMPVVNLSTVGETRDLEAVLAPRFAGAADRRLAAQSLMQFLRPVRDAGAVLPNVGAILKATVAADAIDRTPLLAVYPARLRQARQRAAGLGQPPPATLPLLTADDLAALKPSLIVRTPETFALEILADGAAYLVAFYLLVLLWWYRRIRGDEILLGAAHLLTAVGFALLLSRADPLRDTMLFVRYTGGVLIGILLMAAVSFIDFRKASFLTLSYLPLIGALSVSLLLILFGTGPGSSGARVNLGPVQPIEAIRLLLALFLAGYFARRWELLRQIQGGTLRHHRLPPWLNLPRADYVLPVLVGVAAALAFFYLQKDLGPALFLSCVFLAMYAVARARVPMAAAGLILLVAGFYAGYRLNVSDTLAARVQMWLSPWDNAVRGGDQVAQSIWALSTGGVFGTGLGFGDTRYLPAGHTDLAFAAIGEELGIAGLLAMAAVFAVIAARGFRIALSAASDYGFFLSIAVTLFLVVPVLIMAAGVLGVIPLTGVVTPFLSYGGSAMAANFTALGILTAIQRSPATERAAPFRTPTRYLRAALSVSALGLVAALVDVQVVHADAYVVKPHLGLQADGGRRYQYNQRVLDVIRTIPRGSVFDRRGLPLATGDAAVMNRSRGEYLKLGVNLDRSCTDPTGRCYPLGGAAFHLLGDASTRLNWGAANTSYVERDAEDRLRGFDDHATTVQTRDHAGRLAPAVRRDYREVVPLLRHRHDPDHPAVTALLGRPRDVHLTVDAQLQLRIAAILASHAQKSAGGKAAAIVIDPDTGALLAAASYPFPGLTDGRSADLRPDPGGGDALLDRARYGLYPPGSTFKLVTAAAALRRDVASSATTFTCTRLPDGRVGAAIPGLTRPVRDDVLDTHPHGTISMGDGIAHSCNAYFAQLAMRVGPAAMLDMAVRLGISVAPGNSAQRLRATLPQAGYGQGDVLATPLRMARVAAALASGGVLRDVRSETAGEDPVKTDVLLPPDAAALLARYMREAVVSGTGRSLSQHPWRIAGKTGTAEVSGSASHAWFVGYAPFGPATSRIAFAVIIEHAGYGGRAAAPVAGEIVTAAASAGLVR
ncbi:MAG: FtsW/RodA/SpoVE family cell cycle protein [Acidobacteriota bacterium]